jgi:type VI protein secretion system component VasK
MDRRVVQELTGAALIAVGGLLAAGAVGVAAVVGAWLVVALALGAMALLLGGWRLARWDPEATAVRRAEREAAAAQAAADEQAERDRAERDARDPDAVIRERG